MRECVYIGRISWTDQGAWPEFASFSRLSSTSGGGGRGGREGDGQPLGRQSECWGWFATGPSGEKRASSQYIIDQRRF